MLTFGQFISEATEDHGLPMSPWNHDADNMMWIIMALEKKIKRPAPYVRDIKMSWLEASQHWVDSRMGGGDPVFPDVPSKYHDLPVIAKTKKDGRYTIIDGHHRVWRAKNKNKPEIKAIVIEV